MIMRKGAASGRAGGMDERKVSCHGVGNIPSLITAGTISMCFDSSEQERFDASESIVLIPLPTRSMLFMISAYDSIAMYLAIEPQSLCFYVIAASKRKSEFSTEAGSKYLILGAFSSGILLFGYDRTTTDIY
ncbi:hypothetical protein L2E82_52610 [Cichorium intybus]|nr:hypothetical protein L2E82_52824 [Cichorium intybus]KAI3674111.1 hypothetical protein L2E82_52610 [Cichorium intybus]